MDDRLTADEVADYWSGVWLDDARCLLCGCLVLNHDMYGVCGVCSCR